jgi:multiple sugar transport system ATP-binding protein
MASIVLDHVTKLYPSGVPALADVSLEIADGEQVVVVGPSGCGKSTLLRLIAGLEELTSGAISVGGREISNLAPKDRNVAMVFQDYALYPHMTVRRNLAYSLKLRGMRPAEIEERVHWAADLLSIGPYLDRRPGTLSGGQKQRVALGRAIVREPQVFLMDEPLSNLDAKLRTQMRAEITRLHDRLHITTLYVTHDQAEAMTLADRIMVLKEGEVQQVAPPATMYQAPANMFVAGFIGSPTMNFLRGRLACQEGRYALHWRGLELNIDVPRPFMPANIERYVTQEIIAGLRPEHFSIWSDPASAPVGAIVGRVEAIENLGSERFLFVEPVGPAMSEPVAARVVEGDDWSDTNMIVARDDHLSRIGRGDVVVLAPDPASARLFDSQTERAII